MRVINCTVWAKGYVSKFRLTGDGSVYKDNVKHPLASWSHEVEEIITITFSWRPEISGCCHVFQLIDKESAMYELKAKNGDRIPNAGHTHRSILIKN